MCENDKCKNATEYLIQLLENTDCDILDYLSKPTVANHFFENGEYFIEQ